MAGLVILGHARAAQEIGVLDPFSCRRDAPPVLQPPIREAHVMWSARVWRTVDLREKFNLPLYDQGHADHGCPGLFQVLLGAVLSGELQALDPGALLSDDAFSSPRAANVLMERSQRTDTLWVEDLGTGEQRSMVATSRVEPSQVTRFWPKEDRLFDQQRSALDVRIIGLAPLVELPGSDGE